MAHPSAIQKTAKGFMCGTSEKMGLLKKCWVMVLTMIFGFWSFYSNMVMISALIGSYFWNIYVFCGVLAVYSYEIFVTFTDKREFSLKNYNVHWFAQLSEYLCQEYFPMKLRVDKKRLEMIKEYVKDGKKLIFCFHPHGLTALGHHVISWGTPEMKRHGLGDLKIKKLAASVLFRIPYFKRSCINCNLIDASRPTAEKVLNSKDWHLYICVGGIKEQLWNHKNPLICYLRKRRGFVRLAMNRKNVAIIPCYAFGENKLFTPFPWFIKFRLWVAAKLRIALYGGWGNIFFPLMPKLTPIDVCVGKPVKVFEKCVEWEKAEVAKDEKQRKEIEDNRVQLLLKEYEKNLIEVFNDNKKKYGHKKEDFLEIL